MLFSPFAAVYLLTFTMTSCGPTNYPSSTVYWNGLQHKNLKPNCRLQPWYICTGLPCQPITNTGTKPVLKVDISYPAPLMSIFEIYMHPGYRLCIYLCGGIFFIRNSKLTLSVCYKVANTWRAIYYYLSCHEYGTKKNLSPWQDWYPWASRHSIYCAMEQLTVSKHHASIK